jgi:hypothetical protein
VSKRLILRENVWNEKCWFGPLWHLRPFGTHELPKISLPIREWKLTFFREWDRDRDSRKCLVWGYFMDLAIRFMCLLSDRSLFIVIILLMELALFNSLRKRQRRASTLTCSWVTRTWHLEHLKFRGRVKLHILSKEKKYTVVGEVPV